jgi:hypothetical protein
MNKARRKAIEEIIGKLEELKDQLETLSTEELEAYDNLPESIQSSEVHLAEKQSCKTMCKQVYKTIRFYK